jgi:hypothetical protein
MLPCHFPKEKELRFSVPRQRHQKDVVPEIKPKAQRIMSGIINMKEYFLFKGAFYSVSYIIINPQMKLKIERDRGRNLSSESIYKIR